MLLYTDWPHGYMPTLLLTFPDGTCDHACIFHSTGERYF